MDYTQSDKVFLNLLHEYASALLFDSYVRQIEYTHYLHWNTFTIKSQTDHTLTLYMGTLLLHQVVNVITQMAFHHL